MVIGKSPEDLVGKIGSASSKTAGTKSTEAGVPESNMESKHYCPNCGSFNLKRVHRGYFAKHVFKQSPKYHCAGCGEKVSETELSKNEIKAIPLFFEGD